MQVLENELRNAADKHIEHKTGVDIDGDGQIGHLDTEKINSGQQGEKVNSEP